MKQPPVNIKNKRATFDYELIDTYTAGIVLTGTEIKSIRLGKASLVDTFCYFTKGELWVKNMHIAEYFYGSYNNHTARRERKLLLNKKELEKLQREMKNPGFTIVPVRLFINEKGLALAEAVDVSTNYIGQIERGDRTPSLETTIALCNALHASVDYVVSDDISTRDDEIMTDIRAQLVKLTPDEKQYFYHMIVGYIQLKGENAATKTLLAAKKEL